jgi:antitoxin component of RelBE/YafQ-DinJ toxin-antitoxin module
MEQEQKKSFFQNVLEKASYIGNLAKDVVTSAVRGLARESGALTLWLKNKITGGKEEFVAQDRVSKFLFGEEPLREKNPIQVAKDVINFVGDITWRPFTRAVGKIGLTGLEKITGKRITEPLKMEEAPLPGLYRFVFGEEPLSPLEVEWARYKEWGRKNFGEQWGDKLGTLAFWGFLGFDLWIPIESGAGKVFLRKEILRDIAKSTDKNFIKDTLLRELPELHHPKIIGKIDDIAEKLVEVNKPSAVRKVLQGEFDNIAKEMGVDLAKIRKEMKTGKPEAEVTAKTATEGIKEPPIPPRPPKNLPLDNLPFRPEFNPKGGEFRVRGFFRNLWENKPEFRERVSGLLDELSIYYTPIKNKEIIERAVAELMQYETLDEAFKKIGRKFERTIPRDPGRLATEIVKNVLLSEAYWEAGMKVRAMRIMNNVIGLYGEIGRALQTARFTPRLSPAYLAAWAPKKFTNILKEMAEKKGRTLSDEFLNDIEQKIRKIFVDIEVPAEKEKALMELINKEIAPQLPLTFWEGLNLYRYGNMLSGPVTHLRNIWGNVLQLINKNFFVLPTEILVEYVRHPHNPALRFSDLPKIWKHTLGSIGLAWETAVKAFSSGEVSTRLFDFLKGNEDAFEAMVNFSRYNNVPFLLKPASAISRFMEATDKFFATLVAEAEKYRLMEQAKNAGPKITKTLERQIEEQAQEIAEEYFFRRNLGVGREKLNYFAQALDYIAERILRIRNEALESKNPALRTFGLGLSMLIPFIRTPVNIGIVMLEHSPLGFIRPKDSYTSEKLAQAIVGTILGGVGAWYAFNDRTTWLPPQDQKERAIFYENRKPFSININGVDVPLLYFGPYGVALAVPAALKWALTERKLDISPGLDEALAATALETARFLMSQTSLEGLTRLGRVLSGDEDWKQWSFVGGHLGQYIPLEGFLRTIAKITDPVYRKVGTDFWSSVKADLPYFRQTLEAYENIGGESDFAWWQTIVPYTTGKESMPFSLALKELQIDRRRREAWRLYAKDKLKLEDINTWIERAKLGFKSDRKLTENEIEEGMKVFEALKTYKFKDRNALNGALYFATVFLEQLKKEGRKDEFRKAVEGLPKEYVREIKRIRRERKELEQLDLPLPLPLDLGRMRKEERAEILYKFFKDIKDKVSREDWYRIQRILKEKKILTSDVIKLIKQKIAQEKRLPIEGEPETQQQKTRVTVLERGSELETEEEDEEE